MQLPQAPAEASTSTAAGSAAGAGAGTGAGAAVCAGSGWRLPAGCYRSMPAPPCDCCSSQ